MALTLLGLLKRQLPPPWSKNWTYSSTLQRENFLGRLYLYHKHTIRDLKAGTKPTNQTKQKCDISHSDMLPSVKAWYLNNLTVHRSIWKNNILLFIWCACYNVFWYLPKSYKLWWSFSSLHTVQKALQFCSEVLLQVLNCLIKGVGDWTNHSFQGEQCENCPAVSCLNKQRRHSQQACVVYFGSFQCDLSIYPVSSMMQPNQASGHLQSPTSKEGGVIKHIDHGISRWCDQYLWPKVWLTIRFIINKDFFMTILQRGMRECTVLWSWHWIMFLMTLPH